MTSDMENSYVSTGESRNYDGFSLISPSLEGLFQRSFLRRRMCNISEVKILNAIKIVEILKDHFGSSKGERN